MQNKIHLSLLIIFLISLLTGCGQMFLKMASIPGFDSKYAPMHINESGVNEYYQMIDSIKGQVVTDELGTHYFAKKNDTLYRHFTLMHHDLVLKDLLSSSYGLMEPVYTVQPDTQLKLDWKQTRKRYNFLTKEMGLKLLPLKTTRKYHKHLISYAGNGQKGTKGFTESMELIMKATEGSDGLYNSKYFEDMQLDQLDKKVKYLVHSAGAESFFKESYYGTATDPSQISYFSGLMKASHYNQSIGFIPFEYLQNISKGGSYRSYSSCTAHNKKIDLYSVNYQNERTNIPYYSAIASSIKDDKPSEKAKQKQIFLNARENIPMLQQQTLLSCKEGFKHLGLSGTIESSTLD